MRASCHQRPGRLAAFCLAGLALFAAANAARADTVDDRVAGIRASTASLAAQRQEALLQLYSLQTRLGQAERRVTALEARSAQVQDERAAAQRQLQLARDDFQTAEAQLAARLRQLYVEGDVDPLAVLLGAQSLDEVVSALDGLDRLATQDKDILSQLAKAKSSLREAAARLAARQEELRSLLADARSSRAAIAAARDARAHYIASLRQQQALNRDQIAHLTAQASAAEQQTVVITGGGGGGGEGNGGGEDGGSGSTVPPPPPAHGTQMTVSSTGYCLRGNTATGVPTSHGVIAVDPSVIPLGTRMFVPGYGQGVAADTGSAVVGQTIDLWFSSCAQAVAWGRKTVAITLR